MAHADPQHWRRLEAEARATALVEADPDSTQVMLLIATGYKQLAELAELRGAKQNRVSFGPQLVKAMGGAFDAVWVKIASRFKNNPMEIEAARLKLAIAVLAVASEDGASVHVLRDAALQRMALDDQRS